MALISFACAAPVASWSPSINPKSDGGYRRSKERFQPKDFSDGGDLYSYSHGEKDGRTLEWAMLPEVDMDSLLVFLATINGGRYTFNFTDYDTIIYTGCRVLNCDSFPFADSLLKYYETVLEIEVGDASLVLITEDGKRLTTEDSIVLTT